MKSAAVLQAAIIMLLIACAASCGVAKEYSTRVFKPTIAKEKTDSAGMTLKFMDFDSRNEADSIEIKEVFVTGTGNSAEPVIVKDTVSTENVKMDHKNSAKQPADATKRNTTRSKKIRE